MSPHQEQLAFVLRALRLAGDRPLDGDVLAAHLSIAYRHDGLTLGDAQQIIRTCEEHGWVVGTSDPMLGTQWSLSPKGRLQLANLP